MVDFFCLRWFSKLQTYLDVDDDDDDVDDDDVDDDGVDEESFVVVSSKRGGKIREKMDLSIDLLPLAKTC